MALILNSIPLILKREVGTKYVLPQPSPIERAHLAHVERRIAWEGLCSEEWGMSVIIQLAQGGEENLAG